MDIFTAISSFIYRIRYQLFFGVTFAVVLAIFFTRFLPTRYIVSTTIFTGITSKTSLDDMSGSTNWNTANNAHDNIINLVRTKTTLETVSVGLIAQGLMYGDAEKDNHYITAAHYRNLVKKMSPEVMALVDKNSFEKTVENLTKYRTEDKNNSIYAMFSWSHPHYSYAALSKIKVARKGNSDMIEISYEADDPGIADNTLMLLNRELVTRYEGLLLNTSSDVIKHFEGQLAIAAEKLNQAEEELVTFNIDNNIINYEEQTKHLAAMNNGFEERYEGVLRRNSGSLALIKEVEHQMETRTKLIRENELFLSSLEDVSRLNGKIAEIEIFGSDSLAQNNLTDYKQALAEAESRIKIISDTIEDYRFSKEGVVISDMVQQWLDAMLDFEKSKSELEVMGRRKADIDKQYSIFSPVGPNLGRKDRTVRVAEESYLTLLHHLGLAKLKHKNILLDAGTLQVVTPPEYPLLNVPRKREVYVIVVFFAALIFISGFYLLLDLLDRTLRDKQHGERLTTGKISGAFPTDKQLKYRRFSEQIRRISTSYMANILSGYIHAQEPTIINLLSIEPDEGKSFIGEQLEQYWTERGFTVALVSYHKEFQADTKAFRQTTSVYSFLSPKQQESHPDIIIAEYRALRTNSVPEILLRQATVNLLILNARRAWKSSDMPIYDHLCKILGDQVLLLYLNKASREAVEQFTGQLPPYNRLHNLSYRFFNFGITAQK
ncbi:MAG: hypothetical protein RR066_03515 [Mucinivorans sp.]